MEHTKRLGYIDFIKSLALVGIVLAHTDPPNAVMMVRSFDVPCMVLLSSLLAARSYEKKGAGPSRASGYILARCKRLVLPVWIFLTLYYVMQILFTGKFHSAKYYIASYCLTRYGIDYVWVILIYLYCSLLTPLFHRAGIACRSCILVASVYALYEAAYHLRLGTSSRLLMTTFYYIIPYGSLAFLGHHYGEMRDRVKKRILIASCAVFSLLAVYYRVETGSFQLVQIAKYPPRLYYLSYGILCSMGLLFLCEKYDRPWFRHPFFRFVSTHSMWIYLWHILWLDICEKAGLLSAWFLRFPVVFIGAMLTVAIVNKCLDLIERRFHSPVFAYLRG